MADSNSEEKAKIARQQDEASIAFARALQRGDVEAVKAYMTTLPDDKARIDLASSMFDGAPAWKYPKEAANKALETIGKANHGDNYPLRSDGRLSDEATMLNVINNYWEQNHSLQREISVVDAARDSASTDAEKADIAKIKEEINTRFDTLDDGYRVLDNKLEEAFRERDASEPTRSSEVDQPERNPRELQTERDGAAVDSQNEAVVVRDLNPQNQTPDVSEAQAATQPEEQVVVRVIPESERLRINQNPIVTVVGPTGRIQEEQELATVTMSELSDGKGAHDALRDDNGLLRIESGEGSEKARFDASKIGVDDTTQITDITVLHQLVEAHKEYNGGEIKDDSIHHLSEVLSKMEGQEDFHFVTSDVSAHIQEAYNEGYEKFKEGGISRDEHDEMVKSAAKAAVSFDEVVAMDLVDSKDDVRATLPNADSIAQTAKNNEREV